MELFTPEIGLIFWMLIPFLIVFFVLAKFAWPVIIKGIEKRGKFIDESIESAKEANLQLAGIKLQGEKILNEARQQQMELLSEAGKMRDKLIEEAKMHAKSEADKIMHDAKLTIAKERESAMRDMRREIAELSVEIAEKVLRNQLTKKEQQIDMINRLIDEMPVSQS